MSEASKSAGTEGVDEIAPLRIELLDTDPPIWREVEVPTSITLKVLNDIVQAVMGWESAHLWEFSIGGRRCGQAGKVRLKDLLKPRKTVIDYLYDFGDSWEHQLTFGSVRIGEPGISYPRYIGGENNAPPEDCGGLPGFYNMLDVIADPDDPDHDDISDWLGDYDPDTIDEKAIKQDLARIAARCNSAKTRSAKKKH